MLWACHVSGITLIKNAQRQNILKAKSFKHLWKHTSKKDKNSIAKTYV
jgi:hypothetical protein